MSIFSVRLPYKTRCNLPECGKPVNLVFKTQLGGEMITFCSPNHANTGTDRWEEKVRLNIKPGQPIPVETEEFEADNIQEIEEKGGV